MAEKQGWRDKNKKKNKRNKKEINGKKRWEKRIWIEINKFQILFSFLGSSPEGGDVL